MRKLTKIERKWLEIVMKAEFEGKKYIRKQIKKALVQSDYSKYRLTVDFYVKKRQLNILMTIIYIFLRKLFRMMVIQ